MAADPGRQKPAPPVFGPLGAADSTPVGILLKLITAFGVEKVRGIANVLLLFVIILVVAAAVSLIANIRYALFGTLIAIYLLPFMTFYGRLDNRRRSLRQHIYEWTSLLIATGALILLFFSVFCDRPVPLRRLVFRDISDVPTGAPDTFALKAQSADDWLRTNAADPQSGTDTVRGEALGWINYVTEYLKSTPPARDVYILQNPQPFPDPYREFTRKLTLPVLPAQTNPLGSGFLAYKDPDGVLRRFTVLVFQPINRRERTALSFTVPEAQQGGQFLMVIALPKGTAIDQESFHLVKD